MHCDSKCFPQRLLKKCFYVKVNWTEVTDLKEVNQMYCWHVCTN